MMSGGGVTGFDAATDVGSSEILNAFIALMPDAAVVVDESGSIVSANEQAEELFRYGAGSLIGVAVEHLVPERLRHRHRDHRRTFADAPAKRSMGANFALTGRRRDGHEFPVDVSLAPIDIGGSTLVIAAVRDLSNQFEAFSAQIELAALVRSSTDAIVATSVEGHVTSWNPAAEELFHYDAVSMVGQHIDVLVPEASRMTLEELLDGANQGVRQLARDTSWRDSDGGFIDVAVSVSPLRFQSEKLTGFSFIVRDVTERKKAELELRRLVAEEELFMRQHAATAEIRLKILSGAELDDSLDIICQSSSELVDAQVVIIARVMGGEIKVIAGVGPAVQLVGGVPLPSDSFVAQVIGRGVTSEAAHRSDASNVEVSNDMPDGPTLGVPVVVNGMTVGAMTFVRAYDARPYGVADRLFAETLAAQVAIAFEFERARADRELVMLSGDRERIARDLHDLVVQRIFGAGISLQSALARIEGGFVSDRVNSAIDQLDETIREIRNTIFSLNNPIIGNDELRAQVLDLADRATESLDCAPTVVFEIAPHVMIPQVVCQHVVAVVREGLSNIARHAHAGAVDVSLVVDESALTIVIVDDGIGLKDVSRSSGLENLATRAKSLDGGFNVAARASGGTQLEWTVPLTPTS
jgi:PAS domain S-box-containing protein